MLRRISLIVASLLLTGGAFAAGEEPRQIVLHRQGHGWLLSDDKGMSLYTFGKDSEPGKSLCAGACAKQWPPLLVTDDMDRATGEWSTITREDGAKQWAYRGKPLYRYSRDTVPGDANGDGFNNQWDIAFKAVPTPPGIRIQPTLIGFVLSDQKRMALYSFDKDKPDGSACDVACTRTWVPILAPAMAHGVGDWSVAQRRDGTSQWAFHGKPVYRYTGDVHVGETSGDDVGKGWHAIVLEPPPPNPAWVSVRHSDAGEVFADQAGRTLYVWDVNRLGRVKGTLNNPSVDRPQDWVPVLAPVEAKPLGSWSVVEIEGRRQWAFKGNPVYTNKQDKAPGDLLGLRASDHHFQPLMRSGRGVQGGGA